MRTIKEIKRTLVLVVVTVLFMTSMSTVLATDVSTDIGNSTPTATFDSTNSVSMIDPKTDSNTIQFDIGDDNGISDISSINVYLYRSDGSQTDSDSERGHWTITWDGSSWSINPSTLSLTVNDDVNTGSTSDTVSIDVDSVPAYAAPSENTGDGTVDGYSWNVDIEVDDGSATGTDSGTIEVNQRVNFIVSESSISASGSAGDTLQYNPNIDLQHDGNVYQDVEYSATDQTNGSTSDVIPASAMYLDDDANHDEGSESQKSEQNYATSTQTWSTSWEWSSTNTVYNFVEVPTQLEAYSYQGTITLSAVQNSAA